MSSDLLDWRRGDDATPSGRLVAKTVVAPGPRLTACRASVRSAAETARESARNATTTIASACRNAVPTDGGSLLTDE